MKTVQQKTEQQCKSSAEYQWIAVLVASVLWVSSHAAATAAEASSPHRQTKKNDTSEKTANKVEGQVAPGVSKAPQPLPRPTKRVSPSTSWNDRLPRPSGQTFIVLGIVAGLALVWRLTRGNERNLPSDLVEVYGRVPLNPKQHLHLVRVGNTLLVLIESAQGLQRLAEITDPDEVRSITNRFRKDGTGVVPPELSNVVSAGRHLASFRSA